MKTRWISMIVVALGAVFFATESAWACRFMNNCLSRIPRRCCVVCADPAPCAPVQCLPSPCGPVKESGATVPTPQSEPKPAELAPPAEQPKPEEPKPAEPAPQTPAEKPAATPAETPAPPAETPAPPAQEKPAEPAPQPPADKPAEAMPADQPPAAPSEQPKPEEPKPAEPAPQTPAEKPADQPAPPTKPIDDDPFAQTQLPGLRVWTDDSGAHQVTARFVGIVEGKVRLQAADGQFFRIALDRLSQADKRFVQQQGAVAVVER